MAQKIKKQYKVGQLVETVLYRSTGDAVKVLGKIKDTKTSYGRITYTITGATVVKDFDTRTIKK